MPGLAYRTALPVYRQLRRWKNQVLNWVDAPVVVLIYHRVTDLPSDPHALAVTPENFRAHMRYLREHFAIVRFDGDWSALKQPAVAVTFDDGYADNALEALPVLEDVGMPATFFVTTGALGSLREFWWDELERVILGDGTRPERFSLEDSRHGRVWPTATGEQRLTLFEEIHRLIETLAPARREEWIGQLREWAGVGSNGREINRPLTVAELKKLAASPWATIGAHTISHAPLSVLPEQEQRREIVGSRQQLEQLLGREVRVFSYPFGRKDHYNRTSVALCREAGFCRVAANFAGQAHRWTDPLQIPRQLVRNWDVATFAEKMERFLA